MSVESLCKNIKKTDKEYYEILIFRHCGCTICEKNV